MLLNYVGSRKTCNMDFYALFIRIKATLEKAFALPDPISLSLPLWPALKHYTQ